MSLHVEGGVGPEVVEAVGEGIDQRLELVEAVGQIVAFVELVAPGPLAPSTTSTAARPKSEPNGTSPNSLTSASRLIFNHSRSPMPIQ